MKILDDFLQEKGGKRADRLDLEEVRGNIESLRANGVKTSVRSTERRRAVNRLVNQFQLLDPNNDGEWMTVLQDIYDSETGEFNLDDARTYLEMSEGKEFYPRLELLVWLYEAGLSESKNLSPEIDGEIKNVLGQIDRILKRKGRDDKGAVLGGESVEFDNDFVLFAEKIKSIPTMDSAKLMSEKFMDDLMKEVFERHHFNFSAMLLWNLGVVAVQRKIDFIAEGLIDKKDLAKLAANIRGYEDEKPYAVSKFTAGAIWGLGVLNANTNPSDQAKRDFISLVSQYEDVGTMDLYEISNVIYGIAKMPIDKRLLHNKFVKLVQEFVSRKGKATSGEVLAKTIYAIAIFDTKDQKLRKSFRTLMTEIQEKHPRYVDHQFAVAARKHMFPQDEARAS